jgi:hypothetical protein
VILLVDGLEFINDLAVALKDALKREFRTDGLVDVRAE